MAKEETVQTVIFLEADGYSYHDGPPVEAAVVEVSLSQFENDDIEDWSIKVIETCGHRHHCGSEAARKCNRRLGGPGW